MLESALRTALSQSLVAICALVLGASAHAQLPVIDIERFLPVHTDAMGPGPFEAQRRVTGVSRPFFLIGCDDYSVAWLEKNRERLVGLQAFGLVVEAEDRRAYERVASAAEGLIVRPVAGDLIAQHLGIQNYPALITSDGIFP
jgi:integrating conjugative element protein (TIGR03765 family)